MVMMLWLASVWGWGIGEPLKWRGREGGSVFLASSVSPSKKWHGIGYIPEGMRNHWCNIIARAAIIKINLWMNWRHTGVVWLGYCSWIFYYIYTLCIHFYTVLYLYNKHSLWDCAGFYAFLRCFFLLFCSFQRFILYLWYKLVPLCRYITENECT